MIRALALTCALAPTGAGAFDLGWPIDCTLGETCHIQQYVDRDPTPAATDFTCGSLSYDGHQGTDIALPSLQALAEGVTVRAAAAGTVRGMRDGMPDIAANAPDAPPLEGRDCGNGLVLDHGDGWTTQYCHMKRGSVTVRTGDRVDRGAALGQVGLSGRTEFPHLHVTVRKDDTVIDPFDPDGAATCGGTPAPALWSDPVAYVPGGLIAAGLATAVPDYAAIKTGLASPATLPSDAPALVAWGYAFGARPGDRLRIAIDGPAGTIFDQTLVLERVQAQYFRAAGLRRPGAGWPIGDYRATITLTRGADVLDQAAVALRIGG